MKPFRRNIPFIILMVLSAITVVTTIVMLLWNALLPSLFHFPVITWPQALGLLVLSKLLFGGFRGGGGPRQHWKNKMKQRWMNMQPEEREKFMQEWNRRCAGGGPWKHANPFGPEGPFTTEKDSPAENAS